MTLHHTGFEIFLICATALGGSLLTFFSGFGLGTLLTPVFLFFFPIEIAIAMTAIVHLVNNLFKLALMGRYANRPLLLYFGLPSIIFAGLGASALVKLSHFRIPIFIYSAFGKIHAITALSLVIGFVMMIFAVLEVIPLTKRVSVSRSYLPLGGALSGFFGGLSGYQGALRAAFLSRLGLTPEAFIGTSVVIGTLVDLTRMAIYAHDTNWNLVGNEGGILFFACASALLGAWLGRKILKIAPEVLIQRSVALLLFILGAALASGWLETI